MKGDFSRVRFAPKDNFNGILPQQGKVLLDSDGIAQTLIANDWRETAARDWVGALAGVPAADPESFKVTAATLSGGKVTLTVGDGHMWADGLLVRLEGQSGSTVERTATWLEPPIVATEGSAADVAAGITDAVVLEVWQRAVNGFEMPNKLIEPALGGPDTAERLQTAFAFRLARLAPGQTCANLSYDESGRGKLTASLVPPIVTTGDCPVDGSGGYSGFEHQFYRIEIADTNGGASQFKSSRTNGGLVGRGTFDPATQSIAITANLPAITSANQTSFYLEIESYDKDLGFSRVIAGASATLSGSTLQCIAAANFGAYPSASGTVFFRLWDGISPISSYPISATPAQLENGILLQFDPDGTGKYFPGDYWMFPVRAQGIANPQTLIDAKQPEGIRYYRVPLAEITWASSGSGSFSADTIEDCRTIVPPLSLLKGCCTCRVGDGVESFGEFTSIQAAIDSLPAEGGEVCILPGRYYEHVHIYNRRDIVIHGCGWQTPVASPSLRPQEGQLAHLANAKDAAASATNGAVNAFPAVISIAGSQHIELRGFAVEAAESEVGILIDGTGTSISSPVQVEKARILVQMRGVIDTTIRDMVLTAATLPAILAEDVQLLRIDKNRIAMENVRSLWPAVYASGREIHIDQNWVGIQTAANVREWLPATVTDDLSNDANNASTSATQPSAPAAAYSASGSAASAASQDTAAAGQNQPAAPLTLLNIPAFISVTVALHPGGIQIGGPSTDVYILENEIEGGSRNGITLGSFEILDANGGSTGGWTGVVITGESDDCCTGTLRIPISFPGTQGGGKIVSAGRLTNIQIHRNRIRNMGLCGIGPVGFFDLAEALEIITIDGLNISSNAISRTVLRDIAPVADSTETTVGYGAICIPDVRNLVVRDNTITDFGAQPGQDACGIFILHGEMVEISRNQVIETRDWAKLSSDDRKSTGGAQGGILVLMATPPSFTQPVDNESWAGSETEANASNALASPIYEPGLPALRVEENVVRVPLGQALTAIGIGPFSIVNNHFTCGGMVRTAGRPLAQTVLILNLGTAIESANSASTPSGVFESSHASYAAPTTGFQDVSSGAVLFTNNICQLEARASLQREEASVAIITPDHLIFANNHCWLDAGRLSAIADVLLVAGSLNVVGNRFQEAVNSVLISGLTAGQINITSQNISTYCLFAIGSMLVNENNLALVQAANSDLCGGLLKALLAALRQ